MSINISGTVVNYYYHCKRKCYLFANRINLEDNSEDVRVGKVLHEIKAMDSNNNSSEVKIQNISIDKVTDKYVIELKKSDSDIKAARIQILLYLSKLKEKGIKRQGKLMFNERNTKEKTEIITLDEEAENELNKCINNIHKLLENKMIPEAKLIKGCKKCAYYEYCFL